MLVSMMKCNFETAAFALTCKSLFNFTQSSCFFFQIKLLIVYFQKLTSSQNTSWEYDNEIVLDVNQTDGI